MIFNISTLVSHKRVKGKQCRQAGSTLFVKEKMGTSVLTHCILVDSSTNTFVILGVSGLFCRFVARLYESTESYCCPFDVGVGMIIGVGVTLKNLRFFMLWARHCQVGYPVRRHVMLVNFPFFEEQYSFGTCIWSFCLLTLKALITTAADDIHKYFFIGFQRK